MSESTRELQSNERKDTLDLFTHQQSSDVANVFCLSGVFLVDVVVVVLLAISKSHFAYVSLYSKCTQFWNYIWSNDNDRWWNVIWWPFSFHFVGHLRVPPSSANWTHRSFALRAVIAVHCAAQRPSLMRFRFSFMIHDQLCLNGARATATSVRCTHNRCMFTFKSSFSPPK